MTQSECILRESVAFPPSIYAYTWRSDVRSMAKYRTFLGPRVTFAFNIVTTAPNDRPHPRMQNRAQLEVDIGDKV